MSLTVYRRMGVEKMLYRMAVISALTAIHATAIFCPSISEQHFRIGGPPPYAER